MVRSSEYPRKRNCRLDRSGINSSIERLKIFPPQNENANTRNSTTRFSHLSGPIMPALSAMAVKTRKEIHGRRKTCIRAFCPPYRPPFFSNVVPWDCRSCKRWPRQGWKKKHPPPSIYPSLFLPIPREENGGELKRSTNERASRTSAAAGTQTRRRRRVVSRCRFCESSRVAASVSHTHRELSLQPRHLHMRNPVPTFLR